MSVLNQFADQSLTESKIESIKDQRRPAILLQPTKNHSGQLSASFAQDDKNLNSGH